MKIFHNKGIKITVLNIVFALFVINAFPQKTIFVAAISDGFAKGTIGGTGGDTIVASSSSEFISAVGSNDKRIVVVKGSYDLGAASVFIKSNTTVIGENTASKLTGNLRISDVNNVIVQNLSITNLAGVGTGDGIEVSGATNVFITKCTLIDCKDGSIDVVRESDFVTLSWNRYMYPTRTEHCFPNLIGNSDDKIGDRGKLHCTLHHNWYDDGVIERMPRVRYGQVHCYNNYYSSNTTNYCVGIGTESQVLVENCSFDDQPQLWYNWSDKPTQVQGLIQWDGLLLEKQSSYPDWAPNSTVFDPTHSYSYAAFPAADVKSIVMANAGNTDSNYDPGATLQLTTFIIGQGSLSPESSMYVPGTTLLLEATPAEGWKFDDWSGDILGTENPFKLTISSDMAITANFSQIATPISNQNALEFSLFPNPVKDLLMLNFKNDFIQDGLIQLIDCNGKVILQEEIAGTSHISNMEGLPSGLYIIKVATKEGLTVKYISKN